MYNILTKLTVESYDFDTEKGLLTVSTHTDGIDYFTGYNIPDYIYFYCNIKKNTTYLNKIFGRFIYIDENNQYQFMRELFEKEFFAIIKFQVKYNDYFDTEVDAYYIEAIFETELIENILGGNSNAIQ